MLFITMLNDIMDMELLIADAELECWLFIDAMCCLIHSNLSSFFAVI